MRSHPVGLDVWFLVGPFVYSHTSCVRKAKALARLRVCASSPEPSLVAYMISTIISWAGWNGFSDFMSLCCSQGQWSHKSFGGVFSSCSCTSICFNGWLRCFACIFARSLTTISEQRRSIGETPVATSMAALLGVCVWLAFFFGQLLIVSSHLRSNSVKLRPHTPWWTSQMRPTDW